MNIFTLLLLGVVQSLTEFIPVSSSGHLSLIENLQLGEVSKEGFSIIVLLHFCSFLAIVIFLWNEILSTLKNFRLIILLVIATIPGGVVGVLLKDNIEKIATNYFALGSGFIFTSLFIFICEKFAKEKKDISKCSIFDFIMIGILQAVAVLPGISRSGMTISAALLVGMDRESSFKTSFILALPLFAGAILIEMGSISKSIASISPIIIVAVCAVTILTSVFGLYIVRKVIYLKKLFYFSIYCFIIGTLCILLGIKSE